MAGFDKYSNYNENTSFSSIVFGADKPLLEVELNELQQIINNKLGMIVKSVFGTSSFTTLTDNSIVYDSTSKTLTFNDCIAVTDNGLVAYVHNVSVQVGEFGNSNVYIQLQEVEKSYTDLLYYQGNTLGDTIDNPMKDSRFPFETSRRKVVEFTIMVDSIVPENNDSAKVILIGSWDSVNSVFTKNISNRIERLESRLDSLTS